MALRIAQASSSENKTKNGLPPNQRRTGVTTSKPQGNLDGELNVTDFSGGWSCIYRALDDDVAEKIATFMYSAVANGSHIGYSWNGDTRYAKNTGLFDAMKDEGITSPSYLTAKVNCDCATLVGAAVYFAGIKLDSLRAMVTWKMDEILLGSGAFSKLEAKELCQKGTGIRRGDICWRSGHTAVCLDTDLSEPRISLTYQNGLVFTDSNGKVTAKYPPLGANLLKVNNLTTSRLDDNLYYLYSSKGSADYMLESDATYLITCTQRNSTTKSNDSVWIASIHKTNSHIIPIIDGASKATVTAQKLTINRASTYARVSITRLC